MKITKTTNKHTMFSHTSRPRSRIWETSVRKHWVFCFFGFFNVFFWVFFGFYWVFNGFGSFLLVFIGFSMVFFGFTIVLNKFHCFLLENYKKTNLSRLRGLSGASFWTSSLKENQRKTNRKRRSAGSGAPAELMCLCSCTRNGEDRVPWGLLWSCSGLGKALSKIIKQLIWIHPFLRKSLFLQWCFNVFRRGGPRNRFPFC